MKNLTIGSLRYNRYKSTVLIKQPVIMERPTINKTNRTIEIKQNQRYFQVEVKKDKLFRTNFEQNVYLDYKCRKGVCGKCKVKVANGSTYLQPANSLEEKNYTI